MNIIQLLNFQPDYINNTKIHFAIAPTDKFEPLYAYYRGEFKEWQENQTNKNFEREFILSLIYYSKDEWLFAGIYKRKSVKKINNKKFQYKTELTDLGSEYIGRLIVKFNKTFRQSYTLFENHYNQISILEILREKVSFERFPGYENVKIKFDLLKSIIIQEEISWRTALSNVKGIYLISDLSNGKKYIGSAYGENAFWTRWKVYVNNGHGGNKDLKELLLKNGSNHALNFQFSILETRSMNSEDEEIIKRESFWKDILLSREFGYNKN
jgi:hypothetical protein